MHHYLFEPPEQSSDYFMRIQDRDVVFRNLALSDFDVLLCGQKHVTAFACIPTESGLMNGRAGDISLTISDA